MAFMTEEAWIDATPAVVRGLRIYDPVDSVNPKWLNTEIVDGFGLHTFITQCNETAL